MLNVRRGMMIVGWRSNVKELGGGSRKRERF
jgi:hypothetical protein